MTADDSRAVPDTEAVRGALAELTELTRCRCDPDWTNRGRHHPTECVAEYRSDVETLRAALARDVPADERWGAHGDEDGDAFAEAQRDVPAGRDLTAADVDEAVTAWVEGERQSDVVGRLNRIARGDQR